MAAAIWQADEQGEECSTPRNWETTSFVLGKQRDAGLCCWAVLLAGTTHAERDRPVPADYGSTPVPQRLLENRVPLRRHR